MHQVDIMGCWLDVKFTFCGCYFVSTDFIKCWLGTAGRVYEVLAGYNSRILLDVSWILVDLWVCGWIQQVDFMGCWLGIIGKFMECWPDTTGKLYGVLAGYNR